MGFKFQKQSVLKLEDRIILHKHGYNTPQLAAELFPRLALGSIPVIDNVIDVSFCLIVSSVKIDRE